MREMKDSHQEWLGSIPADWEQSTISSLYIFRNEKVSDKDYPPLSVTMKGIVPQLETAAKTDAHDDRKLVKKGDFTINSRSDRRGSCGISDYDGSVSLINTVLAPREEMNPHYYNWLFHTVQFADEFYRWGHGIVDDLWTTRWQEMKNIVVTVPALEQQEKIAKALDAAVSKVDALIANQKAQIEKLKQYKQSLITEVVTKGLDSDAPMKDSGVDWIGIIPKTWSTIRIKQLLNERKDRSVDGKEEPLSMSQKNGLIPTREMDIVPNMASSFVGAKLAFVDDLVFNKLKAHLGVFSVSKYDGLVSPDYAVYYSSGRSNLKYLEFLFKTPQCISEFRKRSTGIAAGLTRLYTDGLFAIECPFPPMSEQIKIVNYLSDRTERIDSLIQIKQHKIDKLNTYKKSLIYEYVTGKQEAM